MKLMVVRRTPHPGPLPQGEREKARISPAEGEMSSLAFDDQLQATARKLSLSDSTFDFRTRGIERAMVFGLSRRIVTQIE